jgi:transposase InsO family protein
LDKKEGTSPEIRIIKKEIPMTVENKLISKKLSLLELADFIENVSQACKVMGVSRQHFYDIKKAYTENGLEGLKEKSRRQPNFKNRVSPETEEAVVNMAVEYPAYGQLRASNELRKKGVIISSGGVRSIWVRHSLETVKKRLKRIEEKSAKEGIVLTEEQLSALEQVKQTRKESIEEVETHHPGYLLGQDTFYVGYLKGVGRIYQQTVIDTYSSFGFAKLYTAKVPVTAADILNDKVLPMFEEHNIPVLRILTDRGTEYCGRPEKHPYEIYLALNEIEHSKTKAKHPQTNGICERFNQTVLNEFYKVTFRKKMYNELEELQKDLDEWIGHYNRERTHQGKRCQGRTPNDTFLAGLDVAKEKQLQPEVAAV